MEKPNGKLIFYGDEVPITFPQSYDKFLLLLGEILGLEENSLSNVRFSYRDRDEDKIEIKSEDDYKIFMDDIQKGRQMSMTIEVKEESNINIQSCSSSILDYAKKKSGNINNLSEQIKNNSNELIEENNIKNEKNLDLEENINNINNNIEEDSNQLIMNNNINNEINNNVNKSDNIIKPNEENKNIDLNQNNNINNINNQIKKENPMPQNNNQINNINNINNIPQNKNMQNIPQQNIPQMSQNRNMNIMPQNQNIPQMSQNQNINTSKLGNKYLYVIQFPFACSFCRIGPIFRVMYFCKECNLIICQRCEQKEGERHHHPLYKVNNISQFNYLNINGPTAMDKFMDSMEGAYNNAYNSVMNFFGAGGNNNANNNANNNSRIPPRQAPQLVSVVQLARNMYDLRNVTDQQIEEALIKTQGNIDQAVFSLVPQ